MCFCRHQTGPSHTLQCWWGGPALCSTAGSVVLQGLQRHPHASREVPDCTADTTQSLQLPTRCFVAVLARIPHPCRAPKTTGVFYLQQGSCRAVCMICTSSNCMWQGSCCALQTLQKALSHDALLQSLQQHQTQAMQVQRWGCCLQQIPLAYVAHAVRQADTLQHDA